MQGRDPGRFRRKGGSGGAFARFRKVGVFFRERPRKSSAEKGAESSGPAKGQLDGSQEEIRGRRRRRARTAWSQSRGKKLRRSAGDGRRVRGGRSARRGAADRLSCVFSLSSCNVADDRRAAWGGASPACRGRSDVPLGGAVSAADLSRFERRAEAAFPGRFLA